MNREEELIKQLEPPVDAPDGAVVARQRQALMAAIHSESPVPAPVAELPSGRATLPSWLSRAAAVVAALAVVGGGTAVAVSLFSPDPAQVAAVGSHYEIALSSHGPDWRPILRAEEVLCDYRGVPAERDLAQGYASGHPLAETLTEEHLFDECLTSSDAALGHEEAIAAVAQPVVCITSQVPGELYSLPVVLAGGGDCVAAGYLEAPSNLLADLNHRRQVEIGLRGVPGDCPTEQEANDWVSGQLGTIDEEFDVLPFPGGDRCFVPFVDWQRGIIQVSAMISDGNGPTGTTMPPAP